LQIRELTLELVALGLERAELLLRLDELTLEILDPPLGLLGLSLNPGQLASRVVGETLQVGFTGLEPIAFRDDLPVIRKRRLGFGLGAVASDLVPEGVDLALGVGDQSLPVPLLVIEPVSFGRQPFEFVPGFLVLISQGRGFLAESCQFLGQLADFLFRSPPVLSFLLGLASQIVSGSGQVLEQPGDGGPIPTGQVGDGFDLFFFLIGIQLGRQIPRYVERRGGKVILLEAGPGIGFDGLEGVCFSGSVQGRRIVGRLGTLGLPLGQPVGQIRDAIPEMLEFPVKARSFRLPESLLGQPPVLLVLDFVGVEGLDRRQFRAKPLDLGLKGVPLGLLRGVGGWMVRLPKGWFLQEPGLGIGQFLLKPGLGLR
jgi:hypothetical protein